MSVNEPPPSIPQNWLMPLRIAVIAVAYGIYRALEASNRAFPSALIAVGLIILAYSLINRYGLWRRDRSGLLQVGQTILGLGLLALGIVLVLK